MEIERVELQPRTMLGVRDVVQLTELSDFFGTAFDTAAAELSRQGSEPDGPPIALYTGDPSDTVDVTAGFPVKAAVTVPAAAVESSPKFVVASLTGGKAIQTIHTGPYDTLDDTYAQIIEWLTDQKLAPQHEMWEEYLVGPDSGAEPSAWQTRIVFPLA
ncbi:MAG: AraC family transcriptional regulator [Cryobacterium sp.]|nr:AraC family transcriptional regulator [Cryobacterium sp.]